MKREQWSGPEAHHLRGTAYVGTAYVGLGASGSMRQKLLCPQRRCADIRRLFIWRVAEL